MKVLHLLVWRNEPVPVEVQVMLEHVPHLVEDHVHVDGVVIMVLPEQKHRQQSG
jgi:hypothetical protein